MGPQGPPCASPEDTFFTIETQSGDAAKVLFMDTLRFESDDIDISIPSQTPPTLRFELNGGSLSGQGAQVQLTNFAAGIIPDGEAVPFNETIISYAGVFYDSCENAFIINEPGLYYVSWWVATDGAEACTFVRFTVNANTDRASGISPIVTGQVSGFSFFDTFLGMKVRLINTTGANVNTANVPVQASMSVIKVGNLL